MENTTVAELRKELGKRGLPTSGLKADLIKRLKEATEKEVEKEVDFGEDEEEENNNNNNDNNNNNENNNNNNTIVESTTVTTSITNHDSDSTSGDTLYIGGLVRPFTEAQLRELLSQYGNIKYLWMPKFKTHCFVQMETPIQATTAMKKLHGIKWPEISNKTLAVEYIAYEQALQLSVDVARPTATSSASKPLETKKEPKIIMEEHFRKTTHTPHIYWLPSTEEQVLKNREARMNDHNRDDAKRARR